MSTDNASSQAESGIACRGLSGVVGTPTKRPRSDDVPDSESAATLAKSPKPDVNASPATAHEDKGKSKDKGRGI